jgi:hypothetical protein
MWGQAAAGLSTSHATGKREERERQDTYSCLVNILDCHCEVKASKNRNRRRSITPHHVPLVSST